MVIDALLQTVQERTFSGITAPGDDSNPLLQAHAGDAVSVGCADRHAQGGRRLKGNRFRKRLLRGSLPGQGTAVCHESQKTVFPEIGADLPLPGIQ